MATIITRISIISTIAARGEVGIKGSMGKAIVGKAIMEKTAMVEAVMVEGAMMMIMIAIMGGDGISRLLKKHCH